MKPTYDELIKTMSFDDMLEAGYGMGVCKYDRDVLIAAGFHQTPEGMKLNHARADILMEWKRDGKPFK